METHSNPIKLDTTPCNHVKRLNNPEKTVKTVGAHEKRGKTR